MLSARCISSTVFGSGTHCTPAGVYALRHIYHNCTKDVVPVLEPAPRNELLSLIIFIITFLALTVLRIIDKFDLTTVLFVLRKCVKNVMQGTTGLLIILLCVPCTVTAFLVFAVVSTIAKIMIFCKYGKTATIVDPLDTVWGKESKKSHSYINVSLTMDGIASVEKVKEIFNKKLLDVTDEEGSPLYKKFRQIITIEYGYFIWKDALAFDINNHVRVWKDPFEDNNDNDDNVGENQKYTRNRNISTDDRYAGTEDVICRYMNENDWSSFMDPTQPKWEVVILDSSYVRPGQYVVMVHIHHSIGDGVSLMRLILGALVDTPVLISTKLCPKRHPLVWLLTYLYSVCMFPVELIAQYSAKDYNPLHDAQLSGKKIYRLSRGVPLSTVKVIKTATGTTVNDVLMSCISAALSRTFTDKCGPCVTAIIAISNHDLTREQNLINNILMGVLRLPTCSLTPRDRLSLVKSLCDEAKQSPGLLASHLVIRVMCCVLPANIAHAIMSLTGITMGVSNVPGPEKQLSLWGDSVSGLAFWVPDREPTGAGMGIISYRGMITLGLSMDAAMSATPQQLDQIVEEFAKEVDDLYLSVMDKQHQPADKRATTPNIAQAASVNRAHGVAKKDKTNKIE